MDDAQEARGAQDAEVTLAIGNDERRMHVRAYNLWVSLLQGRAYPSIENLDPAGIVDFGPHSVLLDFSRGIEDPSIKFLGRSLREECALDPAITRIADVPGRSLLSRLTDHYLQIIANRAPIGFEAEFVGTRGHQMLYRGILMPFSSDEDTIDYIYGVINWKELADAETQAGLVAELQAAIATPTPALPPTPTPVPPRSDAPVWADGPRSAGGAEPEVARDLHASPPVGDAAPAPAPAPAPAALVDRLTIARESAAAARAADTRTRGALYRALGRAHDFAMAAAAEPNSYARLLAEAEIAAQARAPMTALVKLVFGTDYDKTRVTEFATVLTAARDAGIAAGRLGAFVEAHAGGIKGVVQAARAARVVSRSTPRPVCADKGFAARPTLASIAMAAPVAMGSPMLLVARAGTDGMVEIVGTVAEAGLVRRAMAAIG
ncbi:PAS domain-containing protein [Sphingomonas bacterium]|uniref:PAS domain-containing protein n=1 Tax=Sphingomonas bacterium TaxID=1895847 RepID=UPI0020C6E848|nr:hypothetical protein [Sphingomonas bacterium]